MEIDGQGAKNPETKTEVSQNEAGIPENKPEEQGSGQNRGIMHSWFRDLVVSVVASGLIIIFLYQPVRVEGTSMLPVLEDEDRLFINKLAYRVGEIHRGDVVVFLYPRDHEKSYIKP